MLWLILFDGWFFSFPTGAAFFLNYGPIGPRSPSPLDKGKISTRVSSTRSPPPKNQGRPPRGKKWSQKLPPFHPKPVPHLGQIARKCPRLWGRNMEGGAHFGGDVLSLNSKSARQRMVYPWYHVEGEDWMFHADLDANLYVVSTILSITEVMSVHGQKAAGHAK